VYLTSENKQNSAHTAGRDEKTVGKASTMAPANLKLAIGSPGPGA